MKEEVKNEWVKALRSGEYKQAKHTLKRNDAGHCCLGVLCDISKVGKWEDGTSSYYYVTKDGNAAYTSPPPLVYEWAGIIKTMGSNDHLMNMNDTQGKSFLEIADYIDKNWENI